VPDATLDRQRELVDAFLAATRDGDFEALLQLLDPDVVLRQDAGRGVVRVVRGVEAVARQAQAYSQLRLVIQPVLINGAVGAIAMRDGDPFSIGAMTVRDDKIVELDFITDPERLAQLDLTTLDG
jgi:ketosteroid isomerase-like protein